MTNENKDKIIDRVIDFLYNKPLKSDMRIAAALIEELKLVKNCSIPDVGLSLPDEDEINSMRLELDCPTPNEEEYTTAGFKSGVRWLKNTIERQLQGQ